MVADALRLTHRYGVVFVCAAWLGAYAMHGGTQRGLSLQIEAKLRLIDQRLASEAD